MWRWLRMAPNIAMMVLLAQQAYDIADSGMSKIGTFLKDHPWYVFTAFVSFMLSGAHLVLFVTKIWKKKSCGCCRWDIHSMLHQKMELFFYSIDGSWGSLWVLQLVVQALLPKTHRAFTLSRISVVLVLYGLQIAVDSGCVYSAYDQWRHDAIRREQSVAAAASSTVVRKRFLDMMSLHRKICNVNV